MHEFDVAMQLKIKVVMMALVAKVKVTVDSV